MPSLDTEILALLCPAMGSVSCSVPMAFDLRDLYQSMSSLAPLSTQAPGLCSSCQDGAGRGIPYLCLLVCLFTSPSTSMSLCPDACLLYREEHRWAAELGGSEFQPRFTTHPCYFPQLVADTILCPYGVPGLMSMLGKQW